MLYFILYIKSTFEINYVRFIISFYYKSYEIKRKYENKIKLRFALALS